MHIFEFKAPFLPPSSFSAEGFPVLQGDYKKFPFVIIANSYGICYTNMKYVFGGVYDGTE